MAQKDPTVADVQFGLDQPHIIDLLKRASAEGAALMLSEYQAGRLGEPRTWFDQQGAAQYLRLAEPTLCAYVSAGVGPVSHKIGAGRRFHRHDLDAWIRAGGVNAPEHKDKVKNPYGARRQAEQVPTS